MLDRAPICESCGQSLPFFRIGVRLTPLKARIFDLIEQAGPAGIDGDDLFAIAFAGRNAARSTLKEHVWQINNVIEDIGYRIVGRGGVYRLTELPP
jgi:hypothetical protein